MSYFARTPCVSVLLILLIGLEAKGFLGFLGSLPLYGGSLARSNSVSRLGQNLEAPKAHPSKGHRWKNNILANSSEILAKF